MLVREARSISEVRPKELSLLQHTFINCCYRFTTFSIVWVEYCKCQRRCVIVSGKRNRMTPVKYTIYQSVCFTGSLILRPCRQLRSLTQRRLAKNYTYRFKHFTSTGQLQPFISTKNNAGATVLCTPRF